MGVPSTGDGHWPSPLCFCAGGITFDVAASIARHRQEISSKAFSVGADPYANTSVFGRSLPLRGGGNDGDREASATEGLCNVRVADVRTFQMLDVVPAGDDEWHAVFLLRFYAIEIPKNKTVEVLDRYVAYML